LNAQNISLKRFDLNPCLEWGLVKKSEGTSSNQTGGKIMVLFSWEHNPKGGLLPKKLPG